MQTENIKSFLTFTKKEKRGIMVLLATIIAVLVSAKYIYPLLDRKEYTDKKELQNAADALREKAKDTTNNYYKKNEYAENNGSNTYPKSEYNSPFTGTMFYFDPNTLDDAGWKKLGIKDKTIASMQKYIAKGGRFREPNDLRKVWGLREDEKERLIPYVQIEETQQKTYTNNYQPYEKKEYEKKVYEKKAIAFVDINAGDSVAYDGLPGIGGGYAKRIIKFRDKLGGFYKIEQVAETFGLPDSTYQKIKPYLKINASAIKKININTAKDEELKAHPYIRWQLAKLISEYKKQHGDFKTIEDLKKIMPIDNETYNKIAPYLTL